MTTSERLTELFSPVVLELLERLVDERVEARLSTQSGIPDSSPWLSIAEAAGYMRCSERKVHRLVSADRLPSSTVGRRRLLRRDDLDTYLNGKGTHS